MIRLVLVWALCSGGPGHHPGWDRQVRTCATWAVGQARASGIRPAFVACAVTDDGEIETLRCRASDVLDDALEAVLSAAERELEQPHER